MGQAQEDGINKGAIQAQDEDNDSISTNTVDEESSRNQGMEIGAGKAASVKEEHLKEELKHDNHQNASGHEMINDSAATSMDGKEPSSRGGKAHSRDGKSSSQLEGPIVAQQQGHDLMDTIVNADEADKLDKLQISSNNHGSNATGCSTNPRPESNLQGPAPMPLGADPLVLQRAPGNHQPNSRPGAYMGAPGTDLQRNTTLDFDLVGANADHAGPAPLVVRPPHVRNDQLAVANPVTVDPEANANLGHANPVDLEAQEKKQQEIKKHQQTVLFILALVIIAAAAMIGTVAGTRSKREESATATPTSYGSMTPSEVPSSAPTGALDLFLSNVPDYSLASLNNGSDTPQWKAWNWLSHHQNITFLPEWRKQQLFAMASFFYAFDGENWYKPLRDRWMDDTLDECWWYSAGFGGIGIEGEYFENPPDFQVPSCDHQGKLTSLFMVFPHFERISLNLPPEITMLTSLSNVFFIAPNSTKTTLTEMLPKELYQLSTLSSLTLFITDQDDMGPLPTELGLMTNLLALTLPSVSGTLSSELGMLTNLNEFALFPGSITGTLPTEIGLWTSIESLNIAGSFLSGAIPHEVGNMRNLTQFVLPYGLLTGTIPTELGRATGVRIMHFNFNALTGNLPWELAALSCLGSLLLPGNLLTGTLPMEVQGMKSLSNLHLSLNDFSGSIPSEYGELQKLSLLKIFGMPLVAGTIPSELGQLTDLWVVNISGNPLLSGTLPEQWCHLQNGSCTLPYPDHPPCHLDVDCTDRLCGCDCPCVMNTTGS